MIFYQFILLLLIPTQTFFSFANSESTKRNLLAKAEFVVKGTSTLKSWEMKSSEAEGTASIIIDNQKIINITNLTINLKSNSLKSGNKGMDNNAYKSLKAEEYPTICYELKEIISITPTDKNYQIEVKGDLAIAGETRLITMTVNSKVENEIISFTGETKIKMSDYKIDPPAFMFGTLTTGDEIIINFSTFFNLKN